MARKITAEDFLRIRLVSDPQIAPDGTSAACVVRAIDVEKNVYRAEIWMAALEKFEPRRFTGGDWSDSSPRWSPDGQTLAFFSDRREDADIVPGRPELWTVSASGGELTRIPTPPGPKGALAWSPDGRLFAYIGNPDLDDEWHTNNDRAFVLPAEGSDTARDLTGHTDLAVGYLTLSDVHDSGAGDLLKWSADGTAIYFPVSAFGSTLLYCVEAQGGTPVQIGPLGGEVGGFDITPEGRAVVTFGDWARPHELFVAQKPELNPPNTTEWLARTGFNFDWQKEVLRTMPEPLEIPNGEGGTVYGWLLKPPDFDPAQQYPLVVYVHGGPHLQYGNVLFHELQWLAAEGYVVLYTNPRGSKGYGEAHTKAIKGDWGGPDFRDILVATDYATGLDFVNAHRIALMGGSYGGYMTAWAIGHTDRFTCAIADRLVNNLHSMAGTTDFTFQHNSYFKGNAWDDPSDLWRCSPLAFAGRITTPLLIIHSDGDLRCPVGQAEELFAALRQQRKTVEFVRYPAETSHGLSRNGPPDLRFDRLHRNLEWLNRWLKA
ncbi:MAG TPA: S9 family peptidase [Chthonomonadaceae bacterium]|nr:S9 family peptidase [Chthonomonadaceae bacterium]